MKTNSRGPRVAALTRVRAAAGLVAVIGAAIALPFAADAAGVNAQVDNATLMVTGTNGDDVLVVRLAAGDPSTIEVDVGGDGQPDFSFKTADIQVIQVSARAGNDVVAINETYGPVSIPALIDGGSGDDDLTGGSGDDSINAGDGNDTVNGGGGNDTVQGKSGADRLFGGDGDDTLTGGPGTDELDGGSGDDRFVSNNGDESDRIEGGDGADAVEVNGSSEAEALTTTANGTRVRFDRLSPAPFFLDIGSAEQLVVKAAGGADQFSATGNLATLIAITYDGGAGNDTILGSNGADILLGGGGDDFIDGQQGADTAFGGEGRDTFQWDPGDGSDILDGQGGTDTLLFNGSAANEIFEVSPNGGRVRFTRNIGNIVMDLNDIEGIDVNLLAGADTATVNPLPGTGLTAVRVNAAIPGGAGDGAVDLVYVAGTAGNDVFRATRTAASPDPVITGTGVTVTLIGGEPSDSLEAAGLAGDDTLLINDNAGLASPVGLEGGEGIDTVQVNGGSDSEVFAATANGARFRFDRLSTAPYAINGTAENLLVKMSDGDDQFSAVGNLAALVAITVEGGAGNDTILGSNGADVLLGGGGDDFIDGQQGNDTAAGGPGNDTFQWDPGDGSDTLDGQGGADTMLFNGSNGAELFDVSANTGRVRLTRNLGTIAMDLNNIERLDLNTFGSADGVTVNSLNGTDLKTVNINLAAFGGTGDASVDTITVIGTDGKNVVTVAGDAGSVAVSGLFAAVNISGAEFANDTLTINTLGGNDVLDASGLSATAMQLVANGGPGNDKLTGGAGNDTLFGEDGDDILNGGPGLDILDGGPGNNTVTQD